MIEHNYPLYIVIWLVATVFAIWFVRFISRKMKNTEDRQTKNSLFTVLIIVALPLWLVTVLWPVIFIIGDKNMASIYRYTWLGLIGVFLVYFIQKQRSGKEQKVV